MKKGKKRICMYLLFTLLFAIIVLFSMPKEEKATVFNKNTYCLNHNIYAPQNLNEATQVKNYQITPEKVYIDGKESYNKNDNVGKKTLRMFQGLAYILSQNRTTITQYNDTNINNDPLQQAIWAYVKYINSDEYQNGVRTHTFPGNMTGNNTYEGAYYPTAKDIADSNYNYDAVYNYSAEFTMYEFNNMQSVLVKKRVSKIGYLTIEINKKDIERSYFARS